MLDLPPPLIAPHPPYGLTVGESRDCPLLAQLNAQNDGETRQKPRRRRIPPELTRDVMESIEHQRHASRRSNFQYVKSPRKRRSQDDEDGPPTYFTPDLLDRRPDLEESASELKAASPEFPSRRRRAKSPQLGAASLQATYDAGWGLEANASANSRNGYGWRNLSPKERATSPSLKMPEGRAYVPTLAQIRNERPPFPSHRLSPPVGQPWPMGVPPLPPATLSFTPPPSAMGLPPGVPGDTWAASTYTTLSTMS